MKFTLKQFQNRFPDDDTCLAELKAKRFDGVPCRNCGRADKLSKVKGRQTYACICGTQVYPLSGTIFHKSSTPLTDWFYAMYLMTQTRAGISAKQLERELGVTYKTAWRMFKQIRTLMADDDGDLLKGDVEADETFMHPKAQKNTRLKTGRGSSDSEILFGVVERDGRAKVRHIPNIGALTLRDSVRKSVAGGSTIHTDNNRSYKKLVLDGYKHEFINHWQTKGGKVKFHPVSGNSTQNVENLWSNFKRGIYGVYRHCSPRYLQHYGDEYAWRYSNRHSNVPMFDLLLKRV